MLAIDPGTTRSAFVILDTAEGLREIHYHDKVVNEELIHVIETSCFEHFAIERIVAFGKVPKTLIETIEWGGRFIQTAIRSHAKSITRLYRKTIVTQITQDPRANDSKVRTALIKRHPEAVAMGITEDQWSALAVAECWADGIREKPPEDGNTGTTQRRLSFRRRS